jgi:hypothetical protein
MAGQITFYCMPEELKVLSEHIRTLGITCYKLDGVTLFDISESGEWKSGKLTKLTPEQIKTDYAGRFTYTTSPALSFDRPTYRHPYLAQGAILDSGRFKESTGYFRALKKWFKANYIQINQIYITAKVKELEDKGEIELCAALPGTATFTVIGIPEDGGTQPFTSGTTNQTGSSFCKLLGRVGGFFFKSGKGRNPQP